MTEPMFDYGGDPQLEVAAEVVRAYCGWHVAPIITETVTVDGSGGPVQRLPSMRVISIAGVANDTVPVDDPLWSVSGWMRLPCGEWTGKERGVTVTLEHGWAVCPLPVQAVVKRLARQGDGMIGSGSARVGQVAVTISGEESAGTVGVDIYSAAILDRYRLAFKP